MEGRSERNIRKECKEGMERKKEWRRNGSKKCKEGMVGGNGRNEWKN